MSKDKWNALPIFNCVFMDCRCSAKRVKKVDSRDDYVLPIAKKKAGKVSREGGSWRSAGHISKLGDADVTVILNVMILAKYIVIKLSV